MKNKIVVKHNAGFFSCCSVRLTRIAQYINSNKTIPEHVDSSEQFKWYKTASDITRDITFDYFKDYNNDVHIDTQRKISFYWNHQWKNYSELDYDTLVPLVKKYFTPTDEIYSITNALERKYNLVYENTCVLLYRGNDKNSEIKKCDYSEYLHNANILLDFNKDLVFLIQSDETEFIEFMSDNFKHNSFYFNDEIRHMKKCDSTVDKRMIENIFNFSKKYLAITTILSKCKYIVCSSGNCDLWTLLYRGNCVNVTQHQRDGSWVVH